MVKQAKAGGAISSPAERGSMKKRSEMKKRREAKGLSQSQLANITGLSLRTLQHYECGDRKLVRASTDTVLKLAKVLECSAEELIADE